MSNEHLDSIADDDRLDENFANYLDPLEREELLSQCPGLAATIDTHQWLDQFTAPMRVAPPCFLTAGTIIGDYEVLEEIGQDGQGVVYKARLVLFNEFVVALKISQSGHRAVQEDVRRFVQEVDIQAKLDHPNIVPVKGGGKHEGQLYFTMKLVEGQDLAQRAKDRPMPARRAAVLMVKIARAIHHAHQRRILHRDLKPANVLVDPEGQPFVVDFGLSKLMGPDQPINTGYMVGAAPFVAPEQIDGTATVLSDVYGLGVILYWLLTGRRPFDGETSEEILRKVREEKPASPVSINPELDHWLNRYLELICLKCLEKDPENRYASAEALAVDVERLLNHEPPLQIPVPSVDRIRLWCMRSPITAALSAVVMVLALLMAVVTTVAYDRISDALMAAEEALKQEASIRQSLLETSDFKRRKEAVVGVAQDPTFVKLMVAALGETKGLRDRLNDPNLDDEIRKKLKSELQSHDTRKELQQWLNELLKQERQKQAEPVYNWFVLDSQGLQLARGSPPPSFIGDNYAWRPYFHGGTRNYKDHQNYLNNAAGKHLREVHLSTALESNSTGQALWAVSAPVLDDNGKFIGVAGLRVKIGAVP